MCQSGVAVMIVTIGLARSYKHRLVRFWACEQMLSLSHARATAAHA